MGRSRAMKSQFKNGRSTVCTWITDTSEHTWSSREFFLLFVPAPLHNDKEVLPGQTQNLCYSMVIPCHKQVRSGGVCDNLRPNVLSDEPLALLLNQGPQILINRLHPHWR